MSHRHFVVIGLGSIGRRHAQNLAMSDPSARLTFVRHSGVVDDFTDRLGAQVVTALDDVEGSVDLAVLASPSANHIDSLPTLIAAGWPLVVEKPIVASIEECNHVAALLAAAPRVPRVAGFNLRYLGSIARMKQAIATGELGTVVRASFIAGQWLPDWRPAADYRDSYSADAARGGGVELDLSHEFDLARWFFGDLQVEFARGAHLSDLELASNDTAVSVLSPVVGSGPIVTVSLDYVSRQRVRWYEIVGDRGRLEWNIDGTLELMTSQGRQMLSDRPTDFDVSSTYVDLIDQVLTADGSASSGQTLEDGLESSRLALQVRDQGSASC